jgi:hypothetical protein
MSLQRGVGLKQPSIGRVGNMIENTHYKVSDSYTNWSLFKWFFQIGHGDVGGSFPNTDEMSSRATMLDLTTNSPKTELYMSIYILLKL